MARAATARKPRQTTRAPLDLASLDVSIIDAMTDEHLLAPHFGDLATWERWRIALAAAFGLPPPECHSVDPLEFYREHTGRSEWPTEQASESWLIAGVRGGKSRISALTATFLAVFRDYTPYLSPGEYGTVMVMAADRKQARVVFGYIRAFLRDTPLLAPLVEQETQETITLKNRIRIEVHTASFKAIRGYTVVAAVCDEIAVWNSDGANPDAEIITAVRSRFATIPNAMMLAISSPYARSGELWEMYDRHFGDKGDSSIFVWKAATRDMNPSVSQKWIDQQYARDPARAVAEVGGEFRTDVERFVPLEVVRACVPEQGRTQILPAAGVAYSAFFDPSGGRADPMTCAIGHRAHLASGPGPIVLDAVFVKRPPLEPASAIGECAALLKQYRVTKVNGDRYAGEFPREAFRNHGIEYVLHPKSRSEVYVETLPHLTSRTVELLDVPQIAIEFSSLERRVSPAGRELIDHPKGGHDDLANAVAGLVDLLSKGTEESCVW